MLIFYMDFDSMYVYKYIHFHLAIEMSISMFERKVSDHVLLRFHVSVFQLCKQCGLLAVSPPSSFCIKCDVFVQNCPTLFSGTCVDNLFVVILVGVFIA